MLKKITLLLIVLCSVAATHTIAQQSPSQFWRRMYGDAKCDSLWRGIKRNHVRIIEHRSNNGKVMTMKLDTAGRVYYFQEGENYTVDSMIYDKKGREIRHYVLEKLKPNGYFAHFYDDSFLLSTCFIDNNGQKTNAQTYKDRKVKDTTFYENYNENNELITVLKEYEVGGVHYREDVNIIKSKYDQNYRKFYSVYDIEYKKKHGKDRLLEYGELEYMKQLTDTLMTSGCFTAAIRKMDTPVIRAMYSLDKSTYFDDSTRAIVKKYFPQFLNIEGRRRPYYKFVYDDEHGGRISKQQTIESSSVILFTYDDKGKIISTVEEGNPRSLTMYEYDKKELLISAYNKEDPNNKEDYYYTFYR